MEFPARHGRREADVSGLTPPRSYAEGKTGKRWVDILARMFGNLVNAMEETKADFLGDYFMRAITFGEHGQFYTPEHMTDMMAQIVGDGEDGTTVYDPACGSGRTLLSAAKVNPRRTFVGQDLDHRCVKMAAINLAFYGLRGQVIQGNTLANERQLGYLTGFNGRGFIRLVVPEVGKPAASALLSPPQVGSAPCFGRPARRVELTLGSILGIRRVR